MNDDFAHETFFRRRSVTHSIQIFFQIYKQRVTGKLVAGKWISVATHYFQPQSTYFAVLEYVMKTAAAGALLYIGTL